MINLPEAFTERMRRQLGEDYEAFLACYESEGFAGLRVNTQKISVEDFLKLTPFELKAVPWTENGFYYRKEESVTKHPHYFAGLYYVQEPSAMLPASRLPVHPGEIVLDLCAAPGGKATELSAKLQGEGLLLANDVSASRAKALFKNLAVWGSRNCCITGETPEKLLQACGSVFDKILVDAPCSGEGMFRKDSGLIHAWEEHGPDYYSTIQKNILDQAVQMLKPDGMLLYSTCTFSQEEDEEVIAFILKRYPELELIQPNVCSGFASGAEPHEKCIRLWPHRIQGEGHFLALLHKADTGAAADSMRRIKKEEIAASHRKMPKEMQEFMRQIPGKIWQDYRFELIGEQCLLLPPYQLPKQLRFLRTGILAGTYKRGRFDPSQQLAMLLDADAFPRVINFSSEDPRVLRYLKGETLELTTEESAGLKDWILICVDGYALGWGKFAGGSIKNKYYPGWRLQ